MYTQFKAFLSLFWGLEATPLPAHLHLRERTVNFAPEREQGSLARGHQTFGAFFYHTSRTGQPKVIAGFEYSMAASLGA